MYQDGDIPIGVFPKDKEVLISGPGFIDVALQCIGAGEAEVGKDEKGVVCEHGGMVYKFPKLCFSFRALMEK